MSLGAALSLEQRWQERSRALLRRLTEHYAPAYPDVTGPLCAALVAASHALRATARPVAAAAVRARIEATLSQAPERPRDRSVWRRPAPSTCACHRLHPHSHAILVTELVLTRPAL